MVISKNTHNLLECGFCPICCLTSIVHLINKQLEIAPYRKNDKRNCKIKYKKGRSKILPLKYA